MPESQRPNIVFIMVDDADRKVLEHQASARIRAAIADQGVSATRYLLNQPICGPSRASLLRGRYAQNTGVDGNPNAYRNFVNNGGEQDNFGVWLKDSGYRTGYVGKYLNHYKVSPRDLHVPPGWDYWFALGSGGYNSYEYEVNDNGTYDFYGSDPETDYLTDVLAAKALGFLDSDLAEEAFLLVVTPMNPHSPAIPADRHQSLYPTDGYPKGAANPSFNEPDVTDKPFYVSKLDQLTQGQMTKIDQRYRQKLRCMESIADLVEAVIDKLDEVPGRLANTYVFFTSDNGFHMGEHRLGRDDIQDESSIAFPGGKNTMYEEDIRVPLWVRGPGITGGSTVHQLLGNVDLAPTFRAIAGYPHRTRTSTGARSCRCSKATRSRGGPAT